jgi:hypothetical protein
MCHVLTWRTVENQLAIVNIIISINDCMVIAYAYGTKSNIIEIARRRAGNAG